jgi:hypothetical protein
MTESKRSPQYNRLISPVIVFLLLASAAMILVTPHEASASTATTLSSTIGKNVVSWRSDNAYAILTYGNNEIYKYDGSSFSSLSVSLPGGIWDAEWKPPSNSYALLVGVSGTSTTVYRFDGSSCALAGGYVEYGYTNYGVSWKPDGSYALVVNDWGSLLKYDPGTDSVSKLGDVGWALRDVEWNPTGAYALLVGDGVYKYDGSSITTVEARGAGYGIYFGVGFRSDGSGAMIVSNTGHFRYFDGSAVSEVGSVGNTLYQVHYGPSSVIAVATCVNGHLYECNGTSINDLPTEAPYLRSIDWRTDGTYAVASGNPYTVKYVPGLALAGQVVFDNWGYGSREVASIAVAALSSGSFVSGVDVSMSVVGGGSFDPASGVTDSNGVFRTEYTVPVVSSPTTVTVTAGLSKAGYDQGTAQNMTSVGPSISLSYSITPTTFYLGQNATCQGHASVYGFPSIPVSNAEVQVHGGFGEWDPEIGYTDSNGDFSATYGTHRYVGGDEWHQVIVTKPGFAGDGGGTWLHVLVPPLVPPSLLSPQDGFVTNVLPTYEWSYVWGASLYNVFLGTGPEVSDTEFYARSWGPAGEFNQSSWTGFTPPDGKYYWTVMATNSSEYVGPLAVPNYFIFRNGGIPSPPEIHSLASPDLDGNYELSWDPGSDDIYVKEYIVQESQSTLFTNPWEYHINATSLTISGRPNGAYYYRSCSVDSDGQRSFWSPVVSVEVRVAQTEGVTLVLSRSTAVIGVDSVLLSGTVSPAPSERRDVKITIVDPSGQISSTTVRTESYNLAAYSHTLYPTVAGVYHATSDLLTSTGEVSARTQPMSLTAFSGSGLRLQVDKRSIVADSNVMISGSLNPSRVGAYVELTLVDPNGVQTTERVGISSVGYRANKILGTVGTWAVSARWPGDATLPECSVGPITIDVTGLPKLAILIAGMSDVNSKVDQDIVGETNIAYGVLLRHGYTKNQIKYLAYRTDIDADNNGMYDDVDGLTSYMSITDALRVWAKSKLDQTSDLLFYFVDHGIHDGLVFWDSDSGAAGYIGDEWLGSELDGIACRYQVVILDACYSGSFLDRLSAADRVVIYSAGDNSGWYAGVDCIWYTYSGRMFQFLDMGLNYKDAFILAAMAPDILFINEVWGNSPWLDDNGDFVASSPYSLILYDGDLAGQMGIDFAPSGSFASRALQAEVAISTTSELWQGTRLFTDALPMIENRSISLGESLDVTAAITDERASSAYVIVQRISDQGSLVGSVVDMDRSGGPNYSAGLDLSLLNETGNYTLTVGWTGFDGAGGIVLFINLSVVASENHEPSASIEIIPAVGDILTEFAFDASGSSDLEDSIDALEVRWDFDGDGEWDTEWSTVKTAEHQYTAPGLYTVYLEVRDTDGLTNVTSVQIEVVEAIPEFSSVVVPAVSMLLLVSVIAWRRRWKK